MDGGYRELRRAGHVPFVKAQRLKSAGATREKCSGYAVDENRYPI